jgi:transcriptional regulator with XRE-family HTH domain
MNVPSRPAAALLVRSCRTAALAKLPETRAGCPSRRVLFGRTEQRRRPSLISARQGRTRTLGCVRRTEIQRRAAAVTRAQSRAIGSDIRRQREDAGIGLRRLARASEVSAAHLCEIESGDARPSSEVLNRIAIALGADLSVRLYPNTGPPLRDRNQSRMLEALLRILHPRWRATLEVPVHRPARGVIDCVLDDDPGPDVVAVEAESDIRRLEQQLRWAAEKADSLPSSTLWSFVTADPGRRPRVGRLMLLRSTCASRSIARDFREILAVAYPADSRAIRRALTSPDAPWPGNGMLWISVRGDAARVLDRLPPGVPG